MDVEPRFPLGPHVARQIGVAGIEEVYGPLRGDQRQRVLIAAPGIAGRAFEGRFVAGQRVDPFAKQCVRPELALAGGGREVPCRRTAASPRGGSTAPSPPQRGGRR